MDLWIRSQDKQKLIKVESLTLTNIESIVLGNDVNGEIILGEYSPYKRAEEVLNEIQSKINQQFICKIHPLVHSLDAKRIKEELSKEYQGDFIIEPPQMDIEPINSQILIYEMPEK